jgi:hypothetical protein
MADLGDLVIIALAALAFVFNIFYYLLAAAVQTADKGRPTPTHVTFHLSLVKLTLYFVAANKCRLFNSVPSQLR